jgi:HAD superfamily hydrolase (TIGR01509 family)
VVDVSLAVPGLPLDVMSWTPSAVVFDCDGLLVDTEPCWTIAETELFSRRGLGFGPAEKALLIGKTVAAAGELLAREFGEPGRGAAIARELYVLVEDMVASSARAMDGAAQLVTAAARRVPVAVASNSPRPLLDAALDRAGLAELLPVSIAADEVRAAKPEPDMYLAACAALGVLPKSSLAFEDSTTGLRAALAAGMATVGVPTLTSTALPAHVVFGSLQDEALLAWVARW